MLDPAAIVAALVHHNAHWATYDTLHLMTIRGPLDIVFAPDGATQGCDDLTIGAEMHAIGNVEVRAISVDTWERLNEASGRKKDLEHLDSSEHALDRASESRLLRV